MKKSIFSPPIIIASLIFLVLAITLISYIRAEQRRKQNVIHCREIGIGMSVDMVVKIMGNPDDIIQNKPSNDNVTQYIYLAPLDTYKTIVIVFASEQMIVVNIDCVEVE